MAKGDRSAYAMYAQFDYQPVKFIKLIAGAQMNKVGDLDLSIVPRAGIILYPVNRLSIKALNSEAYRAPSINELYINFLDGMFGDENLKPEKVSTIDLGISYQGEKVQIGLSGFYSKQTDIVAPVFLPNSIARQYSNLGEITYIGGEFEAKYYLNKNFYVNASLLYQTNENDLNKPPVTFTKNKSTRFLPLI